MEKETKDKQRMGFLTHRLACRIYGRPPYKGGRHHWTRYNKCLNALEKFDGDFDKALKHLKGIGL